MYRKEKKIPTFLALFLILTGIGAAYLLDQSSTSLITKAGKSAIPSDVHFTNVSDSSFTVSWVTAEPSLGFVEVESVEQKITFLDDLDLDNVPKPRKTHYVTAKNLQENSSYTAKIIPGNQTFDQQTAGRLETTIVLSPAHGSIYLGNQPAENAIVYLTVGKSAPLSGRVDGSGLWIIPLSNLRTQDYLSRPTLSDNDIVQITAQLSENDVASAVIDVRSVRQNLTIPKMVIGNSYNFIDLLSKKDLIAKLDQDENQNNILGTETSSGNIDIFFPSQDGDSTPDSRPRLRGTGPVGSSLLITVNSTPQTGKVTVENDGTWVWRPPQTLSPGIHNLSVTGYDRNGNLVTLTRKFIVLKSGEAVLGESTPSASLTPSPSASPSPILNLTPTASPTGSPTTVLTPSPTITSIPTTTTVPTRPPTSGSIGITLTLLGLGLTFILTSKFITLT